MRGLTPRPSGERGAVLLIVALAMVAILLVVALVIDLGFVRNTRQTNKSDADMATAAGMLSLAPGGVPQPWSAVCTAANYVVANRSDGASMSRTFFTGTGSTVALDPCSNAALLGQHCDPGTLATWARIRLTNGAGLTIDIRSGYVTPDPDFPEDAGAYPGDNGDPFWGGCDQVAVIVSEGDPAYFGGVAGASGYETTIRSVGRVVLGVDASGVPAFLMLERKGCNVLSEQVGAGEIGIVVDAASATEPGIIHLDSSARAVDGCTGNNNSGGFAAYSSGNTGAAKIVANPSSSGVPGIVAIYGAGLGAPPTVYPAGTSIGVSPAATPGNIVSRQPVDTKYNPAVNPTITNLHAAAYNLATNPAPADYVTISTCSGHTVDDLTSTRVFINCPGGYSPGRAIFRVATDVITNGPVHVSGGSELYLPAARRVVVGGNTTRGLEVSNNGRLGINSVTPVVDSAAGVNAGCSGREGPGAGGTNTNTTTLVVFGGSGAGAGMGGLNVAGRAALCQTSVYLAGPKTSSNATYTHRAVTNGTYDPTCSATRPCPSDNTTTPANPIVNAQVEISGEVRWSAPNQLSGQPAVGAAGVEDLALWTETYSTAHLGGGGALAAFGVYFLPNAPTEVRSPALATPRDAQFIARRLALMQGSLRMQPTPGNAVQVPVLRSTSLVR